MMPLLQVIWIRSNVFILLAMFGSVTILESNTQVMLYSRCLEETRCKVISMRAREGNDCKPHDEQVHMENFRLVSMIVSDKYEELGRMHCLFHCVPSGTETILDVMNSHLRDTCKQPEKLKYLVEFVQHLLDMKDKYAKIISMHGI